MRLLDAWQEMASSLAHNKLRVLLTALSVAWGIFMLVLLLATGRGLQRGVEYDFRENATNSVRIRAGKSSIPHQGLPPGRAVKLVNGDIDALLREVPGIDRISGRYFVFRSASVSRGKRKGDFDVRGCHPDLPHLELATVVKGRFINAQDLEERRKTCVIGTEVRRQLFDEDEEALGQILKVRGTNYQVVGIYEAPGDETDLRKIYIPLSTAQLVYHGEDTLHSIAFSVGNVGLQESKRIANAARNVLARRHRFSPEDPRAIVLHNNLEQFSKVQEVFDWIRVFVWFVGIGTLFAGIMGVSNIMLISVQERTAEIGIRKAVGATRASILGLVLEEAVLITATAGYTGLVAATAVVELVRRYVPENDYIRDPEVDFQTAIAATVLLVVSGALAGLFPALRAAAINPVSAMRRE